MNTYTISGKWLNDLMEDLSGNDRACVILAGAVLDDRVKTLLQKYLLPPRGEKEDKLLGPSRPLESFASRVEIARRLNLISEDARKSLDDIRHIRNRAAHKIDFSFGANSVMDRVNNVLQTMQLQIRAPSLLTPPYNSPKGKFVAAVVILVLCLDIEIGETGTTVHSPTNALANFSFSNGQS
ncbi:MAG: DUF4145 domain-containing protein [Desulfobacterales bacterium]|nr:DUF4145 domain-containing protein [Desulfobacterales bacterium]